MTPSWDDSLSIGITPLDKQHKVLLALTGEFDTAAQKGSDRQALLRLMKNLYDYTNYHFSAEESLFLKFDYPDADQHRGRHSEFTNRVRREFESVKASSSPDLPGLVEFLGKWISEHISVEDRAYAQYYVDNDINISDGYFFGDEAAETEAVESAKSLWDSNGLELRIEGVDEQHRSLVMILQQVNDLNKRGVTPNRRRLLLPNIIRKLFYYSQYHFNLEETLMKNDNYPGLPQHKEQHKQFILKVSGFAKDFARNNASLSAEISAFLVEWTMQHILKDDGAYRDHVIALRDQQT